jgi:hypothetical protein
LNINWRKSYSAFYNKGNRHGKKMKNLKRSSTFANSFIILNRKKYIRQFLAFALLAIFALSNTPTKYLHQLFANHKDFVNKTLTDSNTPQLNVTGINCHCETNVVIAPYIVESSFEVKPLLPTIIGHFKTSIESIFFSESLSFGLRGPPSFA